MPAQGYYPLHIPHNIAIGVYNSAIAAFDNKFQQGDAIYIVDASVNTEGKVSASVYVFRGGILRATVTFDDDDAQRRRDYADYNGQLSSTCKGFATANVANKYFVARPKTPSQNVDSPAISNVQPKTTRQLAPHPRIRRHPSPCISMPSPINIDIDILPHPDRCSSPRRTPKGGTREDGRRIRVHKNGEKGWDNTRAGDGWRGYGWRGQAEEGRRDGHEGTGGRDTKGREGWSGWKERTRRGHDTNEHTERNAKQPTKTKTERGRGKCRRRARPFPASPTLPSAIPYPLSDPNPRSGLILRRKTSERERHESKRHDTNESVDAGAHVGATKYLAPNECVVIVKSLALRKERAQQAYPGVAKRREELTRDEDMRMANASGRLGVRGIDEGCLALPWYRFAIKNLSAEEDTYASFRLRNKSTAPILEYRET
ncbi:hypothetical protein BDN71DRAFT_1429177 [Pleurotus eryngii]|uniref:Uncharacterized protein n=1 Tax=Pleurotus eryngii TaxID=5323 RepID=A0A9P6A190_PLEER|nr:hypothetical protein BDN71DRAFT_1429177 [Pleurotus eryngii]